MSEQTKRRRSEAERIGPSRPGDPFAERIETDRTVTVSHGPYLERLPVANMSIAEIRARFGDRLDIDPQSQAVIDGQEADENAIVGVGQHIAFVRKAGEKGRLNFKPTAAIL